MGPRTIASTWRTFEKLARNVNDSEAADPERIAELDELSQKANRSRIIRAFETLFVQEHLGMDEVTVQFMGGQDSVDQDAPTTYDEEASVIYLNPVGIVRYIAECKRRSEDMKKSEARESFERYRLYAYQSELSKLPSQMILFLLLLRQVAEVMDVTKADKRSSKSSQPETEEDKPYLRLLWAFKQLEAVFREMKGISIRSQYRILWYESDWIIGRK